VIRDKVTIHAGMLKSTSIADLNYIHSSCHVDHDVSSQVGTVLAPLVAIGGEVSLGAFCQIGMGACLHQGSSIGALTMIGMNSTVKGHVRPMSLLYGSPARYHGINLIRLNRLGLDDATLLRASKYSAGELSNESEVTECNALIATLVSQSLAEALHAWTA